MLAAMSWEFEQKEISNGAFTLKGVRNSRSEVSVQAGEDELYRIYEEAFNFEVSLGTLASKALYKVISGAKVSWQSEYHDKAFGSWQVSNPNGRGRYVYDGKDFILLFYSEQESPEWQYRIKEKVDVPKQVFSSLV